jgi:hypothetical protein
MKLIVKANSSDYYIECNYAVVDLNLELIKDLVLRVQAIYKPEHRFAYYSISCPFECCFYNLKDEEDTLVEEEFLKKDKNYIIDNSLFDKYFEEVEDLDVLHSLKIQADGDFWITALGKHSNIMYETTIINIYEIEQNC